MLTNSNSDTRQKNTASNQTAVAMEPAIANNSTQPKTKTSENIITTLNAVKSNLLAEVIFAALMLILGGQAMYLALDKLMPIRPEKARSVGVTPQFIQQLEDKKQACIASGTQHCQATIIIDINPGNQTEAVTKAK